MRHRTQLRVGRFTRLYCSAHIQGLFQPLIALLEGTLDLLILWTLQHGPVHGHAIAKTIERSSEDILLVEQGSLYPALQCLIKRDCDPVNLRLREHIRILRPQAFTGLAKNRPPS